MNTEGKLALAAAVALAGIIVATKKTAAAEVFTCPYGDGLTFGTLKELQDHVAAAHPGQFIPISIKWS